MDYIIDIPTIRAMAESRYDEFDIMRHQLQLDDDLDDQKLDAFVQKIAEPIFAGIDCKACGNCCRSLNVEVGNDDLQRLAKGTLIPISEIRQRVHLEPNVDPDIIGHFHSHPCTFLDGTLCTVYEHRPSTCRDYPALVPDFRWLMDYLIGGAGICPIIYYVLDAMTKEVDNLQQQP